MEELIQSEAYQWIYNTLPEYRGLLFMVNNNPKNKIDGARLKAMGLYPGISDLILLKPGGGAHALECKTPEGIQSPAQKEWEQLIKSHGHDYSIFRSKEELEWIIKHGSL